MSNALKCFVLLSSLLLIFSCRGDEDDSLKKEVLFRLSIGRMEDQVDLIQYPGVPFDKKTRIYMRNALIYIGNGNSKKIMEFTSYGDILSLYYNSAENPVPVLLSSTRNSETQVNRRAYPYPFNMVGEIAVTGNKVLLVEDIVPKSRMEYDNETGVVLNRIILRFSGNGELLDYIGQEGLGGTPFPYIEQININEMNEIIVSARTMDSWIVFWFSSEGELLSKIEIPEERLPVPGEEGMSPQLDTVFPDVNEHLLYMKINYYGNGEEAGSNYTYYKSCIYILDIETGDFEGYIDIPKLTVSNKTNGIDGKKEIDVIYDFLGTASGGYFFLLAPLGGDEFQLLIQNRGGSTVSRKKIRIRDDEIIFRTFYINPDGIMSAFLAGEFDAEIAWWRSDELINLEGE